ncbi:hypothetical protein N6P31_05095 [Pectobacterium betavasculorum]
MTQQTKLKMLLMFWGNRLARIAKIAPVFYGGLSLPTALRAAASGVKNCSRQFFMFTMY